MGVIKETVEEATARRTKSIALDNILDALDRVDSNLGIVETFLEDVEDLSDISPDRIRKMKVKLNDLLNKILSK